MTRAKSPDLHPESLLLTDGLTAQSLSARLAARRCRLARRVGHRLVVFGHEEPTTQSEVWEQHFEAIRQEPLWLYLTGLRQPGGALFLEPNRSVLFLPPADPKREFWMGVSLGPDRKGDLAFLKSWTGIREVRPFNELHAFLTKEAARKKGPLGCHWHEPTRPPRRKDGPIKDARFTRSLPLKKILPVVNIQDAVWKDRTRLDPVDVKNTRLAIDLCDEAIRALLPGLKKMKTETEVRGFLEGRLLSKSSHGLAFPTIVAGGSRAAVLHYDKANQNLTGGELVLLDYGIRAWGMHADISRTLPVSGRFSPMQAILYQIVRDTQKAYQTWVRPGITLRDLNDKAWALLRDLMKTRFLTQGGTWEKPYGDAPHGISHLIGLQIHDGDPFGDYKHRPLEPGELISNEPGLYGTFTWKTGKKMERQTLGIRLEDDLLVTEKGCLNLSAHLPIETADIEKRMAVPSRPKS